MIRLARPGDARAIAEVQVAGWHAAYRGLMPDARLDAFTVEIRQPAWQRNLAGGGRAPTTVFERAGRVVAFASVGASRDAGGWGEVWALYAAPEAWGTGAGRALLAEGLAWLAARDLRRVMLWVLEGNARAIRFYRAAGFEPTGAREIRDDLDHLEMARMPVVDSVGCA
jgi:RimJ/RimL family protein N-acetyltransferase